MISIEAAITALREQVGDEHVITGILESDTDYIFASDTDDWAFTAFVDKEDKRIRFLTNRYRAHDRMVNLRNIDSEEYYLKKANHDT